MHQVEKTYGHDLGLSACFRQWRAKSHCSRLHGYALKITLVFESSELDENGWVIDFGDLDQVSDMLRELFDHKLLVAADDPALEAIRELGRIGLAQVREVERVGCEAFAELIFVKVADWLVRRNEVRGQSVLLQKVMVAEHGANSVTYGRGSSC